MTKYMCTSCMQTACNTTYFVRGASVILDNHFPGRVLFFIALSRFPPGVTIDFTLAGVHTHASQSSSSSLVFYGSWHPLCCIAASFWFYASTTPTLLYYSLLINSVLIRNLKITSLPPTVSPHPSKSSTLFSTGANLCKPANILCVYSYFMHEVSLCSTVS